MDNWKQAMNEVKFEGKEQVLSRIADDQEQRPTLINQFMSFLNYEVTIPLVPVSAAFILCVMIFSFSLKSSPASNSTYTITVVNQWGHYENY